MINVNLNPKAEAIFSPSLYTYWRKKIFHKCHPMCQMKMFKTINRKKGLRRWHGRKRRQASGEAGFWQFPAVPSVPWWCGNEAKQQLFLVMINEVQRKFHLFKDLKSGLSIIHQKVYFLYLFSCENPLPYHILLSSDHHLLRRAA